MQKSSHLSYLQLNRHGIEVNSRQNKFFIFAWGASNAAPVCFLKHLHVLSLTYLDSVKLHNPSFRLLSCYNSHPIPADGGHGKRSYRLLRLREAHWHQDGCVYTAG